MKIPLTKNIEKYQAKAFFGLSGRQICFVFLGLAAGTGIFMLLGATPLAVRTVAAAIVGLPIILLGMLTYGGMSATQLVKNAAKNSRFKYEDEDYKGDFHSEKEK